ncbi:MAG: ribosome biogenesis GTPase Der, partial [Planctomycetota bacterium]
MPIPRIAIVGRPNVGKSSLLNMIAADRVAIVDPTPGVTRDRLSVTVDLPAPDQIGPSKPIELTDTGGFGVYVAEGKRFDEVGADLTSLTKDIEFQIAEAVSNADLILFAIDVQAGITPQDLEIAKMLREQKLGSRERDPGAPLVPVRVVATKCDSSHWEPHAYELAALGFDEPLMCSAQTNYMRRTLIENLYDLVPQWKPTEADPDETRSDLRLAIVGKRNSGKSTLVNALAGQPRVIVSEIAGTTRDAIDVRFEFDGRSITAIDTAGLRRKKSFQDQIEWYALDRAQRAIERCDVVLLLIDAEKDVSQVDEHLAQMAAESEKPVVLVVNKWDLAEGRKNAKGRVITPADYEEYLRKELKGLAFAPIALMSAKDGTNLHGVIDLAFELHEQASTRVPTGELNRTMHAILDKHHPASTGGAFARLYFASQVRTNPPTIVMIVNKPALFGGAYER